MLTKPFRRAIVRGRADLFVGYETPKWAAPHALLYAPIGRCSSNGAVLGTCSVITRARHFVENRSLADNGRLDLSFRRRVNGWIIERTVLRNSKLRTKPNFPLISASADEVSEFGRMVLRSEWVEFLPVR